MKLMRGGCHVRTRDFRSDVACVFAEFKIENPGKRFTFKIQYRLATAESNSSQQRKIKYIHG